MSGLRRLPDSLKSHNSLGALTGLVVLLVIFAALSAPFRNFNNLMLISAMASIIGIAAIGQTFVLLTGGIDFSVSSVIAFTGMVTAAFMKGWSGLPQMPVPVAIAAGLLAGTLIGAGQGWMIAKRQMPPFIFTLGVMVGLRGVTQAATNSAPINALPDDFKWISDGSLGAIPAPTLIMLCIYLVAWYTLRNTKFGRYCYAIGGNETAARLSGVPAANLLMQIGNEMAVVVEDAWLLESGWLIRQIRDALRHLWDDLHLGRSELALWALSRNAADADRTPAAQGSALRDLLLDAIRRLRPQEGPDTNRVHRGYRILQLTYVDGRNIEESTQQLHISRRQYFYDQKEALEMLVEALVRDHQAAA